jgi:MYXO-CTERM domain-containing protein
MSRILALLLLVAGLTAVEPSVTVSATPASIPVGQTIELTITYRWSGSAPEPDPTPDLARLYVTRAAPVEASSTAEGEVRIFRYTVAAPTSGAWALPRPRFQVGETTAQAADVLVQVGADSAPPNLPAARPRRTLPPEPPPTVWWPWAAGAAGLALLLALLFLRRRRHTLRIPPAEVARAALERISLADGKTAAADLSRILRTYAGTVGGFDGPGQTVRELGFALNANAAFTPDEARALVRLAERVEDQRWSPADLPGDHLAPLVADARSWIDTREARVAATPPAP